jgi:hypothetical protein
MWFGLLIAHEKREAGGRPVASRELQLAQAWDRDLARVRSPRGRSRPLLLLAPMSPKRTNSAAQTPRAATPPSFPLPGGKNLGVRSCRLERTRTLEQAASVIAGGFASSWRGACKQALPLQLSCEKGGSS